MRCPRPQAYFQFPWRRQPPPTKAALRAALARFDNRPTSGGGFKRRGPKPPPLSLQGDRILKERGKFEIPLSLSGVLWLLSFDMKRQLTPQIFDLAGGSYAQLSSLRPQAQHLLAAGAAPPAQAQKRDGLRRLFLYLISCPCGSATPAPAPARISASCSPPPACRSGYPARSTSRTRTWPPRTPPPCTPAAGNRSSGADR